MLWTQPIGTRESAELHSKPSPGKPGRPKPPGLPAFAYLKSAELLSAVIAAAPVVNHAECGVRNAELKIDASREAAFGTSPSALPPIQNDTDPPEYPDDAWGSTNPVEYDVAGQVSARQLRAVDLLVSGKCDRETAEAVGVTRVTVTRWRLYHLAFRAALSRRRKETFGAASDRLRNLLSKAIDVLELQMASEDPKLQMAAIRLMISLSKQCSLQPADEPESAREMLEREAQAHRRMRLAKKEADQPAEAEDYEAAIAALADRRSAFGEQEQVVRKGSAIQNDTNSGTGAGAATPPQPVRRGRAGEGAPANDVKLEVQVSRRKTEDGKRESNATGPSPLPNPPPEYRGRESGNGASVGMR